MRDLLLTAGAIVLGAALVSADEGWVIERLDFRLDIQSDSSIRANERLDVDFGRLERHGIFREIVALQMYDDTSNRRYDISLAGVTDASGHRYKVQDTSDGSVRRFRIGDPDRTVSARQSYQVAYRLRGALNAFVDHDELYWNATGTWPVRVDHAIVHVTAPAGAIQRVACFQGREGSTEPCQAQFTPDHATFTATRPLAEGEQMTVVAGLRKGAVVAPVPLLVNKPRDILHSFDRTPGFVGLMFAGFAAAVIGIGSLWWRLGRDRQYTSIQYLSGDTPEERVPLFGSRPVALEFEPPANMRPGQMGLLFDERADTLDVTATIVDLAVRGYLRITELPNTGLLAWFGKPDYQLDRLKDGDSALLEYERVILDGLFDSTTTSQRKLSDLRNKFYKDLEKARNALYADAVDRGWFPRDPDSVRNAWRLIAIALSIAGAGLTFFLGSRWGAGLVGLPVIVAGILLLGVSRVMPRRTARGREAMQRALGFARYMRTAEQHQQAYAERAGIFTSYLPYAIAMKCVDKWAHAFKDIDMQQATAGWYTGSSHFNVASFSSNMSSFSSSLSSAIGSTPGGSGGSGFGGSSGGGGGGGGGGSW